MKLINNDCIAAMKEMPENSVDSIVTDPPYELGFMGKSWDSSGIAFNIEVWQEALRVLKPGGHLIAFSGSRTYHRMAVAIEDAGFEIRDQIMWVYGSGFPKSHNVSKGIDKAAGAERERVPYTGGIASGQNNYGGGGEIHKGTKVGSVAVLDAAQQWDGWGTALKPAHEPMVLARKPLIGTVANNVLTYGVGGLNIDGARVGSEGGTKRGSEPSTHLSPSGAFNTGHDIVKVEGGRWPANFIHDGSDEVVALFPDTKSGAMKPVYQKNTDSYSGSMPEFRDYSTEASSGSAARFFYCAKASKRDRNEGLDEAFQAKKSDTRDAVGAGIWEQMNAAHKNHHPTVKPTTLMQYLVRLVTPPNGTVLDPFMGSGSTGKACAYEGFNFIGIEQSAEYVEIAQARIDFALNNTLPLELLPNGGEVDQNGDL